MNCTEAQVAIRAAIESETGLDAATENHMATCDDCREDYGDRALEHALQLQTVPPPRDGFVDQAIASAIHNAAMVRARRFGVAASIAVIGFVLGVAYRSYYNSELDQSPYAQVTLAVHEGRTVRVVINSPSEQDSAMVTIELGDNLELAGFPSEHRIQWQTSLSEGKNLLALPLTLTDPSDSHFQVTLSFGSSRKHVRVLVRPAVPKPALSQVKA